MKKLSISILLAILSVCCFANETITTTETHQIDGVTTTITTTVTIPDSAKSWYRSDRLYYEQMDKYTMDDFFSALDLPTVFGIGFNPTGNEKGFAYYSQMFLEWRLRKTYGLFVAAGLDSHNQSYQNFSIDQSWQPAVGVAVFGKDVEGNALQHGDVNVKSGTVYNMELVVGPGYRIPLVKDIREFYAHPYVNALNLSVCAQFGYAWSNLNNIKVASTTNVAEEYEISDVNYIHPVMKFDAALEWFTGPMFSVFVMASYMQHLTTMPWDNPETHAGTLAFSVGFAGFF